MDKTANIQEMERKDSPVEILVGFDGYYHFQLGGEDKNSTKYKFSTNDWDQRMFYGEGKKTASWMHKNNIVSYTISNGQIYKMEYDIPEGEAEALVKTLADDSFFSGSYPKHHLERTKARPLMPEQLKMFKAGLEHQLQVLQGKIVELPTEPRRSEAERLSTYFRAQQPALNVLKNELRDWDMTRPKRNDNDFGVI